MKVSLFKVVLVISLFSFFNDIVYSQETISQRIVTGIVADETGESLIGVTVRQKDTNNATTTNIDGEFSIRISPNQTPVLVFSYIGMDTKEVVLNSTQNKINVQLVSTSTALDEIVVVGAYGSLQKRSDMVGSAYQVSSKQLENLPAGRIDQLLDGVIPGMQVAPFTDDASSTKQRITIRVRGEGSMSASNEPLWIVDGTKIYTGDRTNMVPGVSLSISPLTYLNPDDIESYTVLKDATATSIYGSNGANGVIIITTKQGKAGKAKINLSVQSGVSQINKSTQFRVLNAEQYLTLARESYLNSGRDMRYFPFQNNDLNDYENTNTNWTDVFYDTGYYNQTNLALSGGTDKSKYYVSGSYYNQQSTIKGNTQERLSLRTNLDLKLTSKLDFKVHSSLSYNVNNIFNPGRDYLEFLPIYSPTNPDGTYRLYNKSIEGSDPLGNPIWKTTRFLNSVPEREENDHRQKALAANVNLSLEYNIIDGLNSTTQFGIDNQNINEDKYDARTNWSGLSSTEGPIGYSQRNNSSFMLWTLIERLNFNRTFGDHSVSGILGGEASSSDRVSIGATGSGFINDKIKEVSYAIDRKGSSSRSTSRSLSFFAQASYSFDERYYLTVNGRRDGNSGFGSDAQWGNFGSIGSSWNIHNEDFFDADKINILKLKASFGSNGNSRIGSQEALGLYSYSSSDIYMGEIGGSMSGSPNKGLSWETAYITNLGLRIKLFNRVDIELEAYNKKTVDLLSNLDVSRTTGDTRSYRNSGKILNQGIEATVGIDLINNNDFSWFLEINAAHNRNKLLELYNGIEKVMGNYIWREGHGLNTFYVVRWAGVDPRDGSPLWYDSNDNITRTFNNNNRVPWKTSSPDVFGGIRSNASYKNLSVNMLLTYVLGGYSFSSFGRNVMSDGLNIMDENQSINQLDRWQKPGDVASAPKPIWGTSTGSVMSSTRHIYKTTHASLKNLSVSYLFNADWLKSSGIQSCSLSLIGDNLLLWTPYAKKEMNTYRQSISGFPSETSFSLGINLNF